MYLYALPGTYSLVTNTVVVCSGQQPRYQMLEEIRKKETNKKRQENMACKFAKNIFFSGD